MTGTPDQLTPFHRIIFDSLASTNSKMKELIQNQSLPNLSVVQTPNQFAGRGQMGNFWESEPDKNLTFSILFKPVNIEIADQFIISKIISLSVVKSLQVYSIDHVAIKWPNDIYYKDKKLAGILIENNIMGPAICESIIGVGLNVNQTHFVSKAPNPISLKTITGKNFDIEQLLKTIHQNFSIFIDSLTLEKRSQINDDYTRLLYRYRIPAKYSDAKGIFTGTITGTDKLGRLMVTDETDRKRTYEFKEIEYIFD